MLTDALKQLDFSTNQTKVYLALFDLGESRAGALIKETDLHRHIVYTVLDELIERKLVTKVIKNKVQYYQAIDPTPLLLELQQKQEVATQVIKELQNKKQRTSQEIIVYEGVEDVRRFELDHLKTMAPGSTVHILGVIGKRWDEVMGEKTAQKYYELSAEHNIKQKYIGYEYDQAEADYAKKYPGVEYKVIPGPKLTKSNLEFTDDYVALKSFGDNPTVIEIKNRELAEAYKNYFDLLWDQEVKIYKGVEGIKQHRDSSFDDLKKGEEILVMGVSNASNDLLKDYWRGYHKRREAEGIKTRMLWDPKTKEEAQARQKIKGTEIKYLSVASENPSFIEIWKDHVGIGILKENPFIISIDDKNVAQSFKSYFESLWNQENFVITGWEAAANYFTNLYKELPAGEEQLVIAQQLTTVNKKERKFWTEVNKPRIKKGLIIKCLHHPDDHQAYLKTMVDAGDPDLKKTEFRVSKTHAIQAPMSIEIFSDQVVTIHWHGDKPALFILKGKDIAESYKKYWLGLWKDGESLE